MCNCGHEDVERSQADRLRKRAVLCAAGAACMAGLPALFVTGGTSHHVLVFTVIASQIALLSAAVHAIRQRRRLS